MSFLKRQAFYWIFFATSIVCLAFYSMYKEVQRIKKQNHRFKKVLYHIKEGTLMAMPKLGNISLPSELQNIPLSDKTGLVVGSKTVDIRGVHAPYNASLVEHENKYLLFFRHDVFDSNCQQPFYSHIGCTELDRNFEQTEKDYIHINTGNPFSEDPRALKIGDALYLCYNGLISNGNRRVMHMAQINPKDFSLNFNTPMDLQFQHIEKNWTPFEYINDQGKPEIYIEYYIQPHRILKMPDPKKNYLAHLVFPNTPSFRDLPWPEAWGEPRGGTPPQKVGNVYLGLFHTRFQDRNGMIWYLMGAYTFEDKPPFRIIGISHYPILFEGIYESPIMKSANPRVRCIFPSGFVVENRNGRELIHVSCGENDSAVKIVTLDKDVLMKSLKKL